MDALTAINTRQTPQTTQADPRQEKNSAGGYVFTIGDEARFRRFLTIGTEGGSYYVGEADLTKDNAEVVLRMAASDPFRLVDVIVEISEAGRALKPNQALFALAIASSVPSEEARRYALAALPRVARTGTHLFLFAGYAEQFRGWGRSLRRAVADWYLTPSVEDLTYQMVKYRQREGWSHRDLLRLAHPETVEPSRKVLMDWAAGRNVEDDPAQPALLAAFREIQTASPERAVALIAAHPLSWEMLPNDLLTSPEVWGALVAKGMPITALLRQLPRLTNLGVVKEQRAAIVARLTDHEVLRKGRVHPISVLVGMRTYVSGASEKGSSTWTPDRQIVDALDAAFYAAFETIVPTGKRTLLALDVSGSMTWGRVNGLTPREITAAMSMATARSESDYEIVGFSHNLVSIPISPRQRLDDVIRTIERIPMGGTDCSLPFKWAADKNEDFDAVVSYTDNETWAGGAHVHQRLSAYREKVGHDVKSIVVAATATRFSIADPDDSSSLDIAGFDAAVPNLISDFVRGL